MAGTIKKYQFAEGTSVGAPSDLGIASSTIVISPYASTGAYVSANGAATSGAAFLNTTSNKFQFYTNSSWRSALSAEDSSDPTKVFALSFSGQTTAKTTTFAFSSTVDRTITFPDAAGTVVTSTSLPSSLDVATAGNVTIGASIGANNLTLGGSSSTVVVAGNLQVNGTTTTVNSATLNVTDTNITVNNGGNDATSEGAGITVARTSTAGSIIFANAATSKFKLGLLGSEVEVATISGSQTLTNKTISGASNTISDIDISASTTGTLAINRGGTGQTLQTAAFDALAPTTTKGDIVAHDGSDNVRVPVGTNGLVLTANSAAASGVEWAAVTPSLDSSVDQINLSIACSVGSSALTISIKDKAGSDPSAGSPVKIAFRNSSATNGTYNVRSVTGALSTVVSSGSTLGHSSGTQSEIYVYAIDNSGTVELAVSSTLFNTFGLVSTSAEGGAGGADSGTVMYSTAARSNVPVRLIARLLSTQTTAGTWAAVPTETALGGQSVAFGHATSTQSGLVSTTTQTFAGIKNNASMPSFFARQTSSQTITGTAATISNLSDSTTTAFDQGSVFASNTFTCPTGGAGIYLFTAGAKPNGTNVTDGEFLFLELRKNGSTTIAFVNEQQSAASGQSSAVLTAVVQLADGDTVAPYISTNSADNWTSDTGHYTYFGGAKLY